MINVNKFFYSFSLMMKVDFSKRLIKNIYGNNFSLLVLLFVIRLQLKCATNGLNNIYCNRSKSCGLAILMKEDK